VDSEEEKKAKEEGVKGEHSPAAGEAAGL